MEGPTSPRLVTIVDGGGLVPGVELGGRVVTTDAAPSIRALLEAGPDAVRAAVAAARARIEAGEGAELASVALAAPIPDPGKILCLGLNYADHANEASMKLPDAPTIFAKFANCLVGDGADVVIPAVTQKVDYEGELAVVIGRRCSRVSADEALGYVAGYSVFNDVSARDLQMQTPQWTAGKAVDTFGPMGPGIVLADDLPDPQTLAIATRVNGETLQSDTTANMVFDVAHAIAFISSWCTLEPGDVIASGTPAGVGFIRNPPILLQPGDVVEVEIEKVGLLRNPVRAA